MFSHKRTVATVAVQCRFSLVIAIVFPIVAQSPQTALPEFHFTSIDDKLLDQANELDSQITKKGLIYHDPVAEAYLEHIGAQLLAGTPPPERVNFRFLVVRDPMVNAFSLPNGSIYMNTGLIAAIRNEAELASVLSHEITHVNRRHAYLDNRSVRRKNVAIDVLLAGAAAGGIRGGTTFGQSIWLAAQVSQVFIAASVFGYSRALEREADSAGYGLLVHAGYDGKAMTDAFEILDERIEMEPAQPFWRTHPKLEERIASSKSMTLRANALHPRQGTENDYLEHLAPIVRYNIELDLDSRRARTAIDRAQHLVDWAPADPRNVVLLADAYSSLGAKTARPGPEELTGSGKKENRNRMLKKTAEEEQNELAALPGGQRTLAENRSKAESLYRQAIQDTPGLADAHRGLGMLYEDESKNPEAAVEYLEYLSLIPAEAVDRLRIERRLQKIKPRAEDK